MKFLNIERYRYISIAEPLYSLALFTPTIITALEFSGASANLLSVPPYVVGFITTMVTAFVSDRIMLRGPFILFWTCFTIVGYAILISPLSAGVKYFGIFMTVAGVSPCIALAIAYVGANFGPLYRRATVMGECEFSKCLVLELKFHRLLLHDRKLGRSHQQQHLPKRTRASFHPRPCDQFGFCWFDIHHYFSDHFHQLARQS